jgi:DNA polymerase III delta subunit
MALNLDRMAAKGAMQQLADFTGQRGLIDLADLTSFGLSGQGDMATDTLVYGVALRQAKTIAAWLEQWAIDDHPPVMIVRILIGHFWRMRKARVLIDSGMPVENALFQRHRAFQRQFNPLGPQPDRSCPGQLDGAGT